ncbi:hypothetical protein [Arthrobacter sp. H35-D1]|uniref:hypothetical protein n=1 Tax=Arthrobacter sp. H35-D1 TaxID=3046202 RepID=UPI0024BA6CF9|nr:hypothetical protein [Arthrobacter sp. H35-D1]MDJ0314390.1 hypothetical protein [Arthrobacter sp. H35-D1]
MPQVRPAHVDLQPAARSRPLTASAVPGLLVIDAEAFGHGMQGLALPLQHQPLRVQIRFVPPLPARRHGEDLVDAAVNPTSQGVL